MKITESLRSRIPGRTKWLSAMRTAVMVIPILSAGLLLGSCTTGAAGTQITLGEAILLSRSGNISQVVVDTSHGWITMAAVVPGSPIAATDAAGTAVQIINGERLTANIDSLNMADLQTLGFVFPPDTSTTATGSSGLSTALVIILPALLFAGIFWFMIRAGKGAQNQAQSFSRSHAQLVTGDRPKVTFADVADAEEAKEDLREVVEFLKDRGKFQAIGATVPKGVLLVGPPGTGKTLLARAVAGEAGVPFFSVSGSEFVEMFVGVGAARVRDLFRQAKTNSPCIIFIDEIDAVGRQRAGGIPGGHEEREQTLNQILVEMDGFDPSIGIIVLAATNRPDMLDAALLRPGRFDRRATLDRPDTNGRLAILKIHSKNKRLEPNVDLNAIAKETHGFSGADLANLMNEAAILAVRRNRQSISMSEVEEAIDRVISGPERRSLRINPRDRETTAYHEAGHALVAHMLPNVAPVHKISIVARGTMGGYTRLLEEDRYFMTASQFKDTLAVLLAGHASEQMVFNEPSTGPHSDMKQATDLARRMITDFGMSEKLGLRTFGRETAPAYLGMGGGEERDYSEDVAKQIDDEIHTLMDNAHQTAKKILKDNRPRLVHIAEKLLEKETLEGDELDAAFADPLPATPASQAASTSPPTAPQQPAAAKQQMPPATSQQPGQPQ